jgi:hypothetical protein
MTNIKIFEWDVFGCVGCSGGLRFWMSFIAKQISDDPRVQTCEGIVYFDGSPDQLIALIVQDVRDAVQRKRLEELGQAEPGRL